MAGEFKNKAISSSNLKLKLKINLAKNVYKVKTIFVRKKFGRKIVRSPKLFDAEKFWSK